MRLLTALLASTFALTPGGRAQLLPAGAFAARDGRPGPGKTWTVDDVRGRALAAQWNATAASTEVPFDYDHQTMFVKDHGQLAPASGWSAKAEWVDGKGLFADVRWTKKAKALIEDEEYRYISPVIAFDEDTGAVEAVLMASLVNYPALTGMHPAVAQLATQFHHDDHKESHSMNPILLALLSALGLAESATQEQALTALNALKTKPPAIPAALATALELQAGADETAALAAVTKIKTVHGGNDATATATITALHAQVAELSKRVHTDEVTRVVKAALAAGKLMPALEQWAIDTGMSDMPKLTAYLAAAPVTALQQRQSKEGGPDDSGAGTGGLTTVQAMLAAQLGLDPAAYAKHLQATAAAA